MHAYRTHSCADLRKSDVESTVRLSGWIHRKRDHGGVLFVDLRDHYGLTQIVCAAGGEPLKILDQLKLESVVTITGKVVEREGGAVNPKLATGDIEVVAKEVAIQSSANELPMPVAGEADYPEEIRLKYRFLDLRREKLHANIMLRSKVISSIRRRMTEQGFQEFQTPILTSSSPEGARDYLVPSRIHPGKFYALPQAPQQFKQLLMVAGFDRYFQIAPCFRDEDARADRSPGEFYQLDVELSFVTQPPFPRIAYDDAMAMYGSDKPDLRNPIKAADVTEVFRGSEFAVFARAVEEGAVVRAIPAPGAGEKSRSFFDKTVGLAETLGLGGLAYIVAAETPKGPLAKYLPEDRRKRVFDAAGVQPGDAVFFVSGAPKTLSKAIDGLRNHLAKELGLLEANAYRFCWVTDFPFFELDEETQQVTFSHNPFSMPQGGLEALNSRDPLSIKAFQYDIVCNGVELSSGAIRNHRPDVMLRAFEIAGYGPDGWRSGSAAC